MSDRHRPRLTRVLGRPDVFKLSLQGTYFELTKPDLCQLAEQLTRVLANLAKDEAQSVRVNRDEGDPRW